jgi:hypothetical protein
VIATALLSISCIVRNHYHPKTELWHLCVALNLLLLTLAAMAISFSKKRPRV